jgi:hypothetical protein
MIPPKHTSAIHCGYLVSIPEPLLGESGFKSCPGTGFLDWGFLFPQALSSKDPDIDLPLTIHLLPKPVTARSKV